MQSQKSVKHCLFMVKTSCLSCLISYCFTLVLQNLPYWSLLWERGQWRRAEWRVWAELSSVTSADWTSQRPADEQRVQTHNNTSISHLGLRHSVCACILTTGSTALVSRGTLVSSSGSLRYCLHARPGSVSSAAENLLESRTRSLFCWTNVEASIVNAAAMKHSLYEHDPVYKTIQCKVPCQHHAKQCNNITFPGN